MDIQPYRSVLHALNLRNLNVYYAKIVPSLILFFLLGYGFEAFNSTLSGDDWVAIYKDKYQYDWVVSIGRWATRIIWEYTFDLQFAPAFMVGFLFFSYCGYAFIVLNDLNFVRWPDMLVGTLLIVLFPLNADVFSFQMLNVPVGVGLVLISVHHVLLSLAVEIQTGRTPKTSLTVAYGLASAVFLALAVSTYQGLAIFSVLSALTILYGAYNGRIATSARIFGIWVASLLAAIVLYAISVRLSGAWWGVEIKSDGAYSLSPTLSVSNLRRWFDHIVAFYTQSHILMPWVTKAIIWIAACGTLVAIARGRLGGRKAGWLSLIAILGSFACFAIPALRESYLVRNNIIFPLGVTNAILLMAPLVFLRSGAATLIWRGTLLALCCVFAFQLSAISTVTYWSNLRDFNSALQLVDRIHDVAGDSHKLLPDRPVVVIGRYFPLDPSTKFDRLEPGSAAVIRTTIGNCGVASGCQTRRLNDVLKLASVDFGYQFLFSYEPSQIGRIKRLWSRDDIRDVIRQAGNRAPYPSPSSIFVLSVVVVVLLTTDETEIARQFKGP